MAPGSFFIGEDGTLIRDPREKVSDPRPLSDVEQQSLTITEFRYQYGQYGNWTERTIVNRQGVDSPESGERSTVHLRTLTYF